MLHYHYTQQAQDKASVNDVLYAVEDYQSASFKTSWANPFYWLLFLSGFGIIIIPIVYLFCRGQVHDRKSELLQKLERRRTWPVESELDGYFGSPWRDKVREVI